MKIDVNKERALIPVGESLLRILPYGPTRYSHCDEIAPASITSPVPGIRGTTPGLKKVGIRAGRFTTASSSFLAICSLLFFLFLGRGFKVRVVSFPAHYFVVALGV